MAGGLPPVAPNLSALVGSPERFRTTNDLGLAEYWQPGHNDVTINGRSLVLRGSEESGGYLLQDPNDYKAGADLFDWSGTYKGHFALSDGNFKQNFITFLVAAFTMGFGLPLLAAEGAAAAPAGAALDEAASIGAANALSDASMAGANWGAVADFAATGASPLATAAETAAATSAVSTAAAGTGTSMALPTLQQVGQALGIASTAASLAGRSGPTSSTAPRAVGVVPGGSVVYDNGTSLPGAFVPGAGFTPTPYYSASAGPVGSQFALPQAAGLSTPLLIGGAALLVAFALALSHQ